MRLWLFDTQADRRVEAELSAITDAHVERLNSAWVPAFHRRYQLHERDEDFLTWKTGMRYMDLLAHRVGVRGYVATHAGDVQGVLVLEGELQPSRLQTDGRLVYVRYVATAPWNRPSAGRPGRYRGVGTLLVGKAVRASLAASCDGRLGLHSLSRSDEFYRKLCFSDLGPDPANRGLTYFELTASEATRLLRKG
jgi:hypothetical protein